MHPTGIYVAEDAFRITGRGWVLLGELKGTVASGQQLVFENGMAFRIKALQLTSGPAISTKTGLLLDATFDSRQQLLEAGILGVAATVCTPSP